MSGEGEVLIGAPSKRARYQNRLVHYAAVFGRSVRTLKGLIAIGRDAVPSELPPFDDPPRMKDWWVRHMKNRVPDDIAALSAPRPPAATAVGAAPPVAAPSVVTALPSSSGAVGYSGALQRLREAEAAAGRLYTGLLNQAAEVGRPIEERSRLTAEAEQARRAWDELVNRLRPMEKDAAEILSASGRMWLADDVVAANDAVHLVLKESIFGLLRRVRPKLVGKSPAEQDVLWREEVEMMLAALRENKFTAPALPTLNL